MRRQLEIPAEEVRPERAAVLRAQGIPERAATGRIADLLAGAIQTYLARVEVRGVYEVVALEELLQVHRGEGLNEAPTPLEVVAPRAGALALFAVTLGEAVSDEITEAFAHRRLAEAAMLDAVASEGADLAVTRLGDDLLAELLGRRQVPEDAVVLPYSPGYCGWHISGQQALFDRLGPRGIGLTLNPSHVMRPLKSVSGALVAAGPSDHRFEDSFPFCSRCASRGCRARLAAI